MRFAQTLSANLHDSIREAQKSSVHVGRQRLDLLDYRVIEDFDLPTHAELHLIFEINGEGIWVSARGLRFG